MVEPFAGSAAVTLAAAYYSKADHSCINDLDQGIAALWTAIVENSERLVDQYEGHWRPDC